VFWIRSLTRCTHSGVPLNPSIHPLLRYHAPHTAPGIFHVAGIPRDDVDVEVHHRLAGGCSHVHADVVAVGVVPVVEESFCFPGEGEEFCVGRVEEGGDVPGWGVPIRASSAPMRPPISGLSFLLFFENTPVESIVDPEISLLPQPVHLLCKR